MSDQDPNGPEAKASVEEALQIRLMLTACKNSYSESTAEAIAKMGVKAIPVIVEWYRESWRKRLEAEASRLLIDAALGMKTWTNPVSIPFTEETTRDTATEALVKMGPAAIPALLESLKVKYPEHPPSAVTNALVGIGSPAVPALIEALKDESPDVRRHAAALLGDIGDVSAISALVDALKQRRAPSLREGDRGMQAAWAIQEIVEKHQGRCWGEEVPALVNALKGIDSSVRANVCTTLVMIGVQAVPALIDILKVGNTELRGDVIGMLGDIRDVSAVTVLIDAWKEGKKEGNYEERFCATRALGKIGDVFAVPVLVEGLKDENAVMKREAIVGLGKIAKANPGHAALAKELPAFIDALKHAPVDVREHTVDALVWIGVPAVPALIEALKDENWTVRLKATDALINIAEKSEIDLRAVEKALNEYVSVKKEGSAAEIREAKQEARRRYIEISAAARKRAAEKHSLAGDGVILEGELPKPPSGKKMYREGARAFA